MKYENNPYVHRMHCKEIEKHSGPIKSKDENLTLSNGFIFCCVLFVIQMYNLCLCKQYAYCNLMMCHEYLYCVKVCDIK